MPGRINILFPLNNSWFLSYDHNQWMLCCYVGDEGVHRAISFIGSNKDVLLRCIADNGVHIDGAGQSKLDKLPYKFTDWWKTYSKKNG